MQTIVYVVPSLILSGPINVVAGIVRHLDRRRFRPVVVELSVHPYVGRHCHALFQEMGAEVVRLGLSKWTLQLCTGRVARRLQERFGPDVVYHAHGYYPTLLLSRMSAPWRLTTIHNICEEDFLLQKGRWMGRYMVSRYRRALPRLPLCVAICRTMQQHYGQSGPGRFCTVYNGVEAASPAQPSVRLAVRRRLGIAAEARVLLCPAAFTEGKNQRLIVEELRRSERRDFVVLFTGQGAAEPLCRRLSEGDPRFRFLGYQNRMDDFWQAADYMVSASLSEGLPMAVLEAVVRGLPCLLSDIPPHREIAERAFAGSLPCFDHRESGSLLRAFHALLDCRFDAGTIRQAACRFYTAGVMARGYEAAYEALAAGRDCAARNTEYR